MEGNKWCLNWAFWLSLGSILLILPSVKVFWGPILTWILLVLLVFRGPILVDIATSTSCMSGGSTLDAACTSIKYLGVDYAEYCLYLRYFVVRYSGILLSVLDVFSDPALLLLRVLFSNSHPSNTRSISGFHTASCSIFMVLYCEVLLVRAVLGVFYSNAEVFRGLLLSILGVLQVF